MSRKKRVCFWVIMLTVPVLAVELTLRVHFAYQLGTSVLFYGTSLNQEKVDGDGDTGSMRHRGGYIKYHPYQRRFTRDKVTGRLIRATINGHGFRGRDFEVRKRPNTVRVVTLGASSTFGFSNGDDETYPHYLQQLLNGAGGEHFEVINLGIPHLRSGQILALFRAEALPLDPDVVTYYEGINDCWRSRVRLERVRPPRSVVRERLRKVAPLRRGFRWLRDHSIAVFLADALARKRRTVAFTEGDLEDHIRGKSEYYLSNLSVIHDECRRRGITFIVASQQAKSLLVDKGEIGGVTYSEEVDRVRRKLAVEGEINQWELFFLTHSILMRDLEEWARANNVLYVDVIEALDARRDCLVSWVHLTPEGNRIVAEAIGGAILLQIAGD